MLTPEIEITPAMIEAGVSAAREYVLGAKLEDLIWAVLSRFRHAPLLAQITFVVGYGIIAWGLYSYGVGLIIRRAGRFRGFVAAGIGAGMLIGMSLFLITATLPARWWHG